MDQEQPEEAKTLIKAELTALMNMAPKDELINKALSRIAVVDEVSRASMEKMVTSAQRVGFLNEMPALDERVHRYA